MGKHQTLQDRLLLLKDAADEHSHHSYRTILNILSGKGRLLLLMILSLPFCLPLFPGMSVPFGLIIAFIGIRIAFGKNRLAPSRILSKKIKSSSLKAVVNKTLRILKKMERWTHPRFRWMSTHPIMRVINGIILSLLGLALALPIPIPSRTSPQPGVVLFSLLASSKTMASSFYWGI
jgi:hypothetical protein